MSERQTVAIAIVTAFLIATAVPDGVPDAIRKDCPSGAAAELSHNRPVRALADLRSGRNGVEGWEVQSVGRETTHFPYRQSDPHFQPTVKPRAPPMTPERVAP